MRVIVAARLSKARSAQTGIDTQDVDARSWAERNGHEVIATVADKISGRVAPFDRPNLGLWLKDPALIVKYDGIVVSKLDRLSRGRDWGIRQWAEEFSKVLLVVSPELRWPPLPGDNSTAIVWDTLMNVSSAEWENTSARYRRMQSSLKERGFLVGKPPYGYRAEKAGDHKVLVPDETTAAYVRAMADKYLAGLSLSEIGEWLQAEGTPSPSGGQRWWRGMVGEILSNPVYIGRRQSAEGKTDLKVEPILSRETFDAVQAKMAQKAKRRGIASGETALLTSIAYCGHCGSPMYRVRNRRTRADGTVVEHAYYRCSGTSGRKSTCRNSVPLADLDEFVNQWFTIPDEAEAWLPSPFAAREVIETVVIKGHGHEDELAENLADLRELDPDDADYADKHAGLLAERKRLQTLPIVPDQVEERPTGMTVSDLWKSMNDQERREYLLKAGIKVIVRGRGGEQDTGRLVVGPVDAEIDGDPLRVIGTVTRR